MASTTWAEPTRKVIPQQPSLTRAPARSRVVWWPTLVAALVFAVFWETRSLMEVRLVEMPTPTLLQLADEGALSEVRAEGTALYGRRAPNAAEGLAARLRTAVGLPTDGELLVARFASVEDKRLAAAALAARGIAVR